MLSASAATPSLGRSIVFFYYEDLAAAARWYEQVLGFERVIDLRWLVLLHFGDGLRLGLVDAVNGTLRPTDTKGAILAIESTQLEAWLERIQQLDAGAILTQIELGANGLIDRLLLRDPGGYLVELFRWRVDPATLTASGAP
jgi:catechol 2,3-dioxygenase-like lactoylglutathione lyase family enzyme